MTITQDQAVALFRAHNIFLYPMRPEQCHAFIQALEQQVVEQLADESGMMPPEYRADIDTDTEALVCHASKVHKAFAIMQARIEKLKEECLRLSLELAKAKGMDLS